MRKRFAELDRKRKAEKLSPSEQEELVGLTDRIEDFNAERIGLMAQLENLKREMSKEESWDRNEN